MIDFKQKVIDLIAAQVDSMDKEEIKMLVEIPPNYEMGDYAFPAFRLAKALRSTFFTKPFLVAKNK